MLILSFFLELLLVREPHDCAGSRSQQHEQQSQQQQLQKQRRFIAAIRAAASLSSSTRTNALKMENGFR